MEDQKACLFTIQTVAKFRKYLHGAPLHIMPNLRSLASSVFLFL